MKKFKKPHTSRELARFCALILDEKLVEDLVILNLAEIESSPADFFVIGTALSEIQIEAAVNAILRSSKDYKIELPRTEGMTAKEWALLDFFDVVVHIFLKDTREYYNLEKLWGDAEFYKISENGRMLKINPNFLINNES